MSQAVYVLTTRMTSKDNVGKTVHEWRPVGVVTNPQVADEWKYQHDNNDWIPLELDDLSMVEGEHTVTPFKPRKPVPTETRAEQAIKNTQEINDRLIDIVETLAKKYKDKDVLKLVNQLKAQPQGEKPSQKIISSKTARVLKSHTEDCAVQKDIMNDCTCLNDVLGFQEDLSGKWTMRGCKDCGRLETDGAHAPDCPRVAQNTLFASSLLKKQHGNPNT